jgi:hypothetical protein
MAAFQRGKLTKVTFEIEYPDGSTKVSELEDPESVKRLSFDEAYVDDGDQQTFNASEADWKQNPAMIIYRETGGGGGIPFCTHNGCSQ